MDITMLVLILLILVIIGIVVYLVITFYQHKKQNDKDFITEKSNRLQNIKSVVTQVNQAHVDMDEYNDTQFSIINTNVRANRDNIERTDTKFNNYTSNIDTIIKIRETFTSDSNVAPSPSPALKKKDIDVLAQVNALAGVTIKDLGTDRSFQICGKTGDCIQIPNAEGDTYLRAINSNASLILDSPVKAYNDINFYKRSTSGTLEASPAMWMRPSDGQMFASSITGNTGKFNSKATVGIAENDRWPSGWTSNGIHTANLYATGNLATGTAAGVVNASIDNAGNSKFNTMTLGEKFRFSGVGDAHGNDDWLRMFDKNNRGYYGGIAMGKLWVGGNSWLNGTAHINNANVGGNFNLKGGVSAENPNRWGSHFPWSGDNKNYIRGDTEIRGTTNQLGDINVHKKLRFLDPAGHGTSDPYYFEKVSPRPDVSTLRLTINDNQDEALEIWADSCRSSGGCAGQGVRRHAFNALGDAIHTGKVTAGSSICAGSQCLTANDIQRLRTMMNAPVASTTATIAKS